MNIGILLPLSNAYPGIGSDFMEGLHSFLLQNHPADTVTFIKENIGFGGSGKDVYTKAEKLLITDEVEVLIAYVDEKVVSMLYPLVQATGKLLIVVNPGANYPLNWTGQSSVIRLNLQHAFCCWLTGALAAKSGTGIGVLTSTFYDCGYLHSAAMVKNFMDSGGTILYNYINNRAYNDTFEIIQLTDFLTANPGIENLLCVADELPASLFYSLLNLYSPTTPLHLFVSPMMVQGKALANITDGFNFSIDGHVPWQSDSKNEANQLFIKTCKRPANIFSLLGWETAMIIHEVLQQNEKEKLEGEALITHLESVSILSPRGKLKLDSETRNYIAPIGRYTLKPHSAIPEIEWLPVPENEWRTFTSKPTEGAVTGWTNTYLCY